VRREPIFFPSPFHLTPYTFNFCPLKTGKDGFIGCFKLKDRLGIRAKGRKIHGSEVEYQLRECQTDYGGWQKLDDENTFDWN
jgi:hypothetical protein